MTGTIEARVRRGAALLDERMPGWWREIDLGSFDLGSCDDCVLGQVFGGFEGGLDRLGLDAPDEARFGFNAPWETLGRDGRDVAFDTLAVAWAAEVRARLAADADAAGREGVEEPELEGATA